MRDPPDDPFHPGERALQERFGSSTLVQAQGARIVRDHPNGQHRDFHPLLHQLCIGAQAADGSPWASMRCGAPGFVTAPDPRQLQIAAPALPGDPVAGTYRLACRVSTSRTGAATAPTAISRPSPTAASPVPSNAHSASALNTFRRACLMFRRRRRPRRSGVADGPCRDHLGRPGSRRLHRRRAAAARAGRIAAALALRRVVSVPAQYRRLAFAMTCARVVPERLAL